MARVAPENAPILAVPDCVLAMKRTVALPPWVRASVGSMLPNEEVNVTTVPFCTGVPADSVTDAVTSAVPLTGTTVVLTVSVMVDSVGASSGTLSQADKVATAMRNAESDRERDTGKANKDNRRMGLAGQGSRADQRGYAMAALLVSMSVMAVMMAAALPVWTHFAQREKEEELIWRGEQYRRAIMLFQRRYANTFPPTVDILVEQKFLRKKYKDPITNDDFQIIPVGGGVASGRPGMPGAGTGPSNAQAGMAPAGGFGAAQPGAGPGTTPSSSFGQATQPAMGIQGVTSKSKDTSIKLYNGMDRYNQWAFVYLAASTQAGAGGGGFARPGMGGQPGGAVQPFGQPQPGGGFGQPGGGFGQPGGGFGRPGGGFGQPGGGGFGQPGTGSGQPFGQPGQPMPPPSPGGFGAPSAPGSSVFTPVTPGGSGQTRPPVGGFGTRPPGE